MSIENITFTLSSLYQEVIIYNMGIVAGIDIGSTTTKIVLMQGNRVIGTNISSTGSNCKKTVKMLLCEMLKDHQIQGEEDIQYTIATGYGRRMIHANEIITEITANAKAVKWLMQDKVTIRTIINIGGQDCKVIALNDKGMMVDFVMNDKCAAGTGRFLEVMSRVLEVELDELGILSGKAEDIPPINSLCTVFGESEVISLLSQGRRVEDIIAGIHKSIAKRVGAMVRKAGMKEAVFFDGGTAFNQGLKKALETELEVELYVPPEPQVTTALGAAIIASERLFKKNLVD
ncbi:MAG: acyl-CoA dehydratase activase [Candidatus Loosdrechtia sp.]|uniref:acyl-CoA dehydratase activase n=1 Tax=Candidatus Loosdrechtia sp. TaxID=3101272 RepID=UPI003A74E8AA|nr:MAG: acyl-CoA dehydratase activase [Candidatus Jettenia sp. AMX2]